MREGDAGRCQCEHESHFSDEIERPANRTPHYYGVAFPASKLVEVKTVMGKYIVCLTCRDTCMKDVAERDLDIAVTIEEHKKEGY